MKLNPRVTPAALDLVTRFEGLRRSAAQLSDGRWIVGYGHTLSARQGATVDEADARALLMFDLSRVADALDGLLRAPLSAPQFEALTAFAFNIGLDNFKRSTVLKSVNEGAYLEAAAAIELWRKADVGGADVVVDALVRRRAAEKAHFLTPSDSFPLPATPVVQPTLDHAAMTVAEQFHAPSASEAPGEAVVLPATEDAVGASSDVLNPRTAVHQPTPDDDIALGDFTGEVEPPVSVPVSFPVPATPAVTDAIPAAPPLDTPRWRPPPRPDRPPSPVVAAPPSDTLFFAPAPLIERQEPACVAPVAEPPASFPTEPPSDDLTEAVFPQPELFVEDFASPELTRPSEAFRPADQERPFFSQSTPYYLIGLLGVALFTGALVSIFQKATLSNLLIGVLGVLAMSPAAGFILLPLTRKSEATDPPPGGPAFDSVP